MSADRMMATSPDRIPASRCNSIMAQPCRVTKGRTASTMASVAGRMILASLAPDRFQSVVNRCRDHLVLDRMAEQADDSGGSLVDRASGQPRIDHALSDDLQCDRAKVACDKRTVRTRSGREANLIFSTSEPGEPSGFW
jgi:hypothetical protein